MSPQTALESCCIFDGFLCISLRLTFGGTPCPNLWETFGQPTCDIANELIQNSQWDHNVLFDPLSDQLLVPKRLPPDTPFFPALPLAVDIPINGVGKGDIYVDDSIFVCPDLNNNIERVAKAVPLAINALARPLSPDEPLNRTCLISQKTFLAEASFNKCKMVLGWELNTRFFSIHLPENKYIAWCKGIDDIIMSKRAKPKDLHTIEGRLNHAAYIVPTMRHFLSRLQALRMVCESQNKKIAFLPTPIIEDLLLCKNFLKWARNGISMNLISTHSPSIYIRSDACENGLGGYNIYSGKAWRLQIPTDLLDRAHINTLEFFASVISIRIEVSGNSTRSFECILAQSDNTSAAGWLKKSNFMDSLHPTESSIRLIIARKLASLVMDSESCLYSQWFPGNSNNIADALSRDHLTPNNKLCSLLLSLFPEQTPAGLTISEIPNEMQSWLSSLLLRLPKQQQQQQKQLASATDPSHNDDLFSQQLVSTMTSTLTTLPYQKSIKSSVPSWRPSDQINSQNKIDL
jgi:hypothetical protein